MIDCSPHLAVKTKNILNDFYCIPQYVGFQRVLDWVVFKPLIIQINWLNQWSHSKTTSLIYCSWYFPSQWRPQWPRSWPVKLRSTITRDQIPLESERRYRRIRKTALHFLRYVAHTCDIIVMRFLGKPVFHVAKKLVVFIKKAVERKLTTLEIQLLHKNDSYDRHFAKVIERNELFLLGETLDNWSVNLSFTCSTKHLKTVEQVSFDVLWYPTVYGRFNIYAI